MDRRQYLMALGGVGTVAIKGPGGVVSAESNPIEISDWYDLDNVRNDLGGDYVLVADLDNNTTGYDDIAGENANGGDGFNPIGDSDDKFAGTLDGQGYKIKNLVIDRPSESDIGLFGMSNFGAIIENMNVIDATVTGSTGTAALVGQNNGTVMGSYVSGTIIGRDDCGVLVGQNVGAVQKSHASGEITVDGAGCGGLVGGHYSRQSFSGLITQSHANVKVNGDIRVGGLVGRNRSTLKKSYATGNVDGNDVVGGLVGYCFGTTVEESYATGNVSAKNDFVGGLMGGIYERTTVNESYATGNVSGNNEIGGLVGGNWNSTVKDSFAKGDVDGDVSIGGLIGRNDEGGVVKRSHASGEITGVSVVGGLCGTNTSNSTIEESYWDKGMTIQGDPIGDDMGTSNGLTGFGERADTDPADEMQGSNAETNMDALDFDKTWRPRIADYPTFEWNPRSFEDYANNNGVVEKNGVLLAVDEWRTGSIDTVFLLDVIDYWRSGKPVA